MVKGLGLARTFRSIVSISSLAEPTSRSVSSPMGSISFMAGRVPQPLCPLCQNRVLAFDTLSSIDLTQAQYPYRPSAGTRQPHAPLSRRSSGIGRYSLTALTALQKQNAGAHRRRTPGHRLSHSFSTAYRAGRTAEARDVLRCQVLGRLRLSCPDAAGEKSRGGGASAPDPVFDVRRPMAARRQVRGRGIAILDAPSTAAPLPSGLRAGG
jgi:hypothetical protein